MWEIEPGEVVPCGDILTHVLVEKLEHEWDTISKDEMLSHVLKLVDVVDLEML